MIQVAMEKLDLNGRWCRGHSAALSWSDELRMLKLNKQSSRIGVLLEQNYF